MLTFELEGLDELEREWERAVTTTLARGAVYAVNTATAAGVAEAKSQHRYKDRTGALTRSIQSEPATLSTANSFDSEGAIYTDSPHAIFVEEGTKAHEIRPKLGSVAGPLQQGQSRKKRGKGSRANTPSLAWQGEGGEWHHAKVVHHPGTKPLPFMGPAYLKAERVLAAELEKAAERFAEELNRG